MTGVLDSAFSPGKTALLINVRARRALLWEAAVVAALDRQRIVMLPVVRIEDPARLDEAVVSLLEQGVDRLIVGGGDGTLGTVAGHLAHRSTVLGVLPLGTANDFARTLGIPIDPTAAVEVIAQGQIRLVDLGRANETYFLNVASVGMSVSATSELSPEIKRRLGSLAYLYAGAIAFTSHPTFRVRVQSGQELIETSAHQFVVGNGRFFGGGVLVAPQSSLEDGLLHAYALGTRGRWDLLKTVACLRMGVPIDRPGDFFFQTPALRVETWPPLKVDSDGEIRTQTPVTFAVEPQALRVYAPMPDAGCILAHEC